uniref:RNA-binding protein AU-1/Ribonuclease E/G domain-containing protein n=1 Tax=Chenopodium quinoa TaxID=63459 RepID=A0A803MAT1_CHEQI
MVCPVNCHYHCFIRDGRWTCYDAISRVKPRFPLSNNVHERLNGATLARLYKTWPNTHLHGSLIQEQHLPVQPSVTAFSKDQEDIVEYFDSDSIRENPFLEDLIVTNGTLKNFPNDHVTSQSSSNNFIYGETNVNLVAETPIIEEPTQDEACLQELQEQHHIISEKAAFWNREPSPFMFPLFDTSKENGVTCPSSSVLEKNLDISHFKQAFLEEEDELTDNDVEVEEFEGHLDGNRNHLKIQTDSQHSVVKKHRSTNDIHSAEEMWANVCKGTKILVKVVKEGLGKKRSDIAAYPKLRSGFWVLITRCKSIGVSKNISGVERTRLKVIAKSLQHPGFVVTIRTVAAGHSLRKDLEGLLATWRNIVEHAKSATLAADEGVEGVVPVILHQAMGQTLSVVQDYFNEKVKRMVVDSPRTYHETKIKKEELETGGRLNEIDASLHLGLSGREGGSWGKLTSGPRTWLLATVEAEAWPAMVAEGDLKR